MADTVITGPSGTVVANRGIGVGVTNPIASLASLARIAPVSQIAPVTQFAQVSPLVTQVSPFAQLNHAHHGQVSPLVNALTNLGVLKAALGTGLVTNTGLLSNGLQAALLANTLANNGLLTGL